LIEVKIASIADFAELGGNRATLYFMMIIPVLSGVEV
jgi:hypothetical protein